MTLGVTRVTDRVRNNERGTMLHCSHILRLAESLISRSGKRRNSGRSEDSDQGSLPAYVFHTWNQQIPRL